MVVAPSTKSRRGWIAKALRGAGDPRDNGDTTRMDEEEMDDSAAGSLDEG